MYWFYTPYVHMPTPMLGEDSGHYWTRSAIYKKKRFHGIGKIPVFNKPPIKENSLKRAESTPLPETASTKMNTTSTRHSAFTAAPRPSWICVSVTDTPSRNPRNSRFVRFQKHSSARPTFACRHHVSRKPVGVKDFSLNTSPSAPSFFLSSSPNNTDSLEPIFFADAFNQPLLEAVSLELHAQNKNLFLEEGSLRTTRGVSSERKKGEKSNNPQPSSSQPSSLSTSVPTPTNAAQAAGDIQGENNAKNEYLTDQLEKHQKENLAKKKRLEKKRKQKKRVRSQSRQSYPNSRNALKDTFQMYMDDISREDLLSQAEVNVLARRIKLGSIVENLQCSMESSLGRRASIPELADKLKISTSAVQKQIMAGTAAKNSLVAANLRLVTSVARKMALSKGTNTVGIALDDMIQEGSVGLIRAAEKFDAGRGYKFSTYATWWVRAYIMRSISTQSRSIKVPGTIIEEYSRIQKEYSKHSAAGNFKPDDLVIARGLGITQAKLRFILQVVTQVPTSLDIKLGHGEDAANSRSLVEVVEGSDKIEERMVKDFEKKELDSALRDCLDSVERAVIRVRFGLDDGQPRSLRETGDLLGLSKERIRQIVFRALPKMKTPKMQKMLTNVMSD